jgi:hypothetical protein
MKIHDVFHVALLRPFSSPTFPGQLAEAPGPVEAEGNSEYEVSNIVDSRVNKRTGKLSFLVEWLGYENTDENTSWEPREHVIETAAEKVAKFHQLYPTKPSTNAPRLRRKQANL